jgi:hypothetical protein
MPMIAVRADADIKAVDSKVKQVWLTVPGADPDEGLRLIELWKAANPDFDEVPSKRRDPIPGSNKPTITTLLERRGTRKAIVGLPSRRR